MDSSSSAARKRGRGGCENDDSTDDAASGGAVPLERIVHPDFEELGRQFPALGAAWRRVCQDQQQQQRGRPSSSSTTTLDPPQQQPHTHHPHSSHRLSAHVTQEFSMALTKALLHVHWGIALDKMPWDDHHLCPPVPNRYFYVRWLQTELVPRLRDARYFVQTTGDDGSDTAAVTTTLLDWTLAREPCASTRSCTVPRRLIQRKCTPARWTRNPSKWRGPMWTAIPGCAIASTCWPCLLRTDNNNGSNSNNIKWGRSMDDDDRYWQRRQHW